MIQKPHTMTFTGVDERTDLTGLKEIDQNLSSLLVEWGFLYSAKRAGKEPRYPSRDFICSALANLCNDLALMRSQALHVCGTDAIEQLWRGELDDLIHYVERVQINGTIPRETVEDICGRYPQRIFITQHTALNVGLLRVPEHNHQLLVDGSGGRGQVPKQWRRPSTSKRVGFAGGLGPLNIDRETPLIARAAAGHKYWIDMESKLRSPSDLLPPDQDCFDLVKCRQVITAWEDLR